MGRRLGEKQSFLLVGYLREFYDISDSAKSSVDGLIYRKTFSEASHMLDSSIIYFEYVSRPIRWEHELPVTFHWKYRWYVVTMVATSRADAPADPVTPLSGCVLHDAVRVLSPTS